MKGVYKRKRIKHIDIHFAIELNKMGLTRRQIGKIVGLSRNTLTQRFKEVGWKILRDISKKLMGENNASWAGENASKNARHLRLYHRKGAPKRCEICGTTEEKRKYHWASINHTYKDDSWKRLCQSCHSKVDGHHKNLGKYAEYGYRWKHSNKKGST